MLRRNADVPQDQRIQFRIGINLDEIIFEDGDIFGSGVNIAARLEQSAQAGEVLISGAVHEQVSSRLELQFHDVGDLSLKNLSQPVRAYRVGLDAPAGEAEQNLTGQEGTRVVKPSIAVLPFENMSGDPEQEFFADGLTEDLLTELSRRHELFVISRNSCFVYKGQAVNVRDVGDKLGARYIVEGSVRKAGNRVRVTVQLIDSECDGHVWAEKYDRDLDDIFTIQDEVISAVVATLPGRIEASQQEGLARKKPSSFAAYECVLAAKVLHHRSTYEDNAEATKLIDRAIELDPDYAHAHAWSGCIRGQAWGYGWCDDSDAMMASCEEAILKAASMDDNDADVHRLMGAVEILRNNLARARYHQERALSLNPNYDLVVVQMGELLTWSGRPDEGAEWIQKAMRLNPHHPARFWSHLGKARFGEKHYDQAVDDFAHLPTLDTVQNAYVAACFAWLGDDAKARKHVEAIYAAQPDTEIKDLVATLHYAREEDLQHFVGGVRKAGLS